MKINIHSDNIKITEAIKTYIGEKLGRLDKYFESANNINARVVIRVRDRDQIIEVTIPADRFTLRNEEANTDLYAAIDTIVDKLERQIRKNKTKIQNKVKESNNSDFKFDDSVELEEDEEENKIVKRKKLEMKPMDEEEAILEMNMLGHDFFIFEDVNTESVCVLYKRKDGHYGIIETK